MPIDPKCEKLSASLYKLGPLGDPKVLCSYLVIDEKIAVVDCGPASVQEELLKIIESIGIRRDQIDYLFLTHIHVDHAGGTSDFLVKCSNAIAYVPERGFKHLVDPTILNDSARKILGDELMNYWGEVKPVKNDRLVATKWNSSIQLGKNKMTYLPATGHAPHQCILHETPSSVLFAADALGIVDEELGLLCPTSPPPAFDYDHALKDIWTIESLGSKLICLPHFRTIIPSYNFFAGVIALYNGWYKIIDRFLKERNVTLDQQDYDLLYSRLLEEYPVYAKLPKALELQVRRVDITGFAQWREKMNGL